MELKIKARNLEVTETLRKYLEKKIGKMNRYLPKATEAYIELSREGTKSIKDSHKVEVTLRGGKAFIRAEERSADIFAAIDSVVDKLQRRIERYKGKLYDKSRARAKRELVEEAIEETPRVVRVKRFPVSPMSEEEAIEQMELLGHDFFVFLNSEDGEINVIYRRRDGNYGLIKPEIA
ncbi:MAG: ribosome-associated translation inhibitor RaiA [Chloroflexi bacterium]|nr:MAG: ribosome-associated translation inhibitor RaiA [Chloroflexota bacterium]HDN80391.1 ribosome-associated translation inhibitor RaiA [Chloroflexota bacterium]